MLLANQTWVYRYKDFRVENLSIFESYNGPSLLISHTWEARGNIHFLILS